MFQRMRVITAIIRYIFSSRASRSSLRIRFEKRPLSESQVTINRVGSACGGSGSATFRSKSSSGGASSLIAESYHTSSSQNVLRARRGVIRMLIVVVLTFAICNLPYHARKMWQYWSHDYDGGSTFSSLFTPLTFLVTYFNSGINPLLYAFMSRNFRKGMREVLCCSLRGGGRGRGSQRHHTSSFVGRSSTRSTTKALSVTANPESWLEQFSLRRSRAIDRSAKSRISLERRNSLQNRLYALNEVQDRDTRPKPFVSRSSSTSTVMSVVPERSSYRSYQPRTSIQKDDEATLWRKVHNWWWRHLCSFVESMFQCNAKVCLSWNNARKST
jgi:hypothetical protein